jgi:hypothetical protein
MITETQEKLIDAIIDLLAADKNLDRFVLREYLLKGKLKEYMIEAVDNDINSSIAGALVNSLEIALNK